MIVKFQKHKSVLGVVLEDGNIEVCDLYISGEKVKVRHSLRFSTALDLLTGDPELVGREIRNHLDQAGIRENRCVVCVPLKWFLSIQAELPQNLSEPDMESLLRVKSEREFPFPPEDLSLAMARFHLPDGSRQALILAMPLNHRRSIEKILKAANLRLESMTLGIASLIRPESSSGVAALLLSERGVDIGIASQGAISLLRSLPGAVSRWRSFS